MGNCCESALCHRTAHPDQGLTWACVLWACAITPGKEEDGVRTLVGCVSRIRCVHMCLVSRAEQGSCTGQGVERCFLVLLPALL